MRIIARSSLRDFWQQPKYADAEQPLKAWFDEARTASWTTPHQIKKQYRNASIIANNRVVFNIAGNKYRLIVAINYDLAICFIKFIGSHKDYDAIDAPTVERV